MIPALIMLLLRPKKFVNNFAIKPERPDQELAGLRKEDADDWVRWRKMMG